MLTAYFNFQLILCLVLLPAVSGRSIGSAMGYLWVESDRNAGHAQTCLSEGYIPTPVSHQISWNESVLNIVVNSLGYTTNTTFSPYGVDGCCVSGLWCDNGDCFTQSYGMFQNYGALMGSPALPIYSCLTKNESVPIREPFLLSASYSNGSLSIVGNNLGYDPDATVFSANGRSCYEADACSAQCRTCGSGGACTRDSICLAGRGTSDRFCYKFCSGLSDASCPCGAICDTTTINTYAGVIPIFLCNYGPFAEGGCSNPNPSQQRFMCKAPELVDTGEEGAIDVNVSVTTTTSGAHRSFTVESSDVNRNCRTDEDCFDNNVCSIDRCNVLSLMCEHTPIPSCGSTPNTIREHRFTFTYTVAAISDLSAAQEEFRAHMIANNKKSSVSKRDDYPAEVFDLHFNFSYFGSIHRRLSINPNGLISLPPLPTCKGVASSVTCIVYNSESNTVSPWHADWFPGVSSASVVYFMEQRRTQTSSVYGIGNVDAFHVLYDTVYRYRTEGSYQNPNTFSVSIYEDGSIRFRYHVIHSAPLSGDYFGIWGPRYSSERSNTFYHEEPIGSSNVKAGSDVVFCDTVVFGCPAKACVIAGGEFSLFWDGSLDCIALGAEYRRQFVCNWAGGITKTTAVVGIIQGKQTLSCPVPSIDFEDGSLLHVDITAEFQRVSSSSTSEKLIPLNEASSNERSVYGISDLGNGEVVKHATMVKYFGEASSAYSSEDCGCSPLGSSAMNLGYSFCDACGVCRGNSNQSLTDLPVHSSSLDCNGSCFGRAYVDDCGITCAAGSTLAEPDNSCNAADVSNYIPDDNIIGQLIFIIIVICCLSCLFSICIYFSRTVFVSVGEPATVDFIFLDDTAIQLIRRGRTTGNRGLSPFEREALGAVIYNDLLQKSGPDNAECSICLLNFKDGDMCRILPEPCGHCFHIECIDKWFDVSPACPLCKRSIKMILLGEDESEAIGASTSTSQLIREIANFENMRIGNYGNVRSSTETTSSSSADIDVSAALVSNTIGDGMGLELVARPTPSVQGPNSNNNNSVGADPNSRIDFV